MADRPSVVRSGLSPRRPSTVIRHAASASCTLLRCPPEGETMPNLSEIVRQLKTQRDQAQKEVERLNAALMALGNLGSRRRIETSQHSQETETSLSCCAQENCGSSACSMGEVEGRTPQQVSGFGSRFPQFHSQIFRFHAENCIDTDQATI